MASYVVLMMMRHSWSRALVFLFFGLLLYFIRSPRASPHPKSPSQKKINAMVETASQVAAREALKGKREKIHNQHLENKAQTEENGEQTHSHTTLAPPIHPCTASCLKATMANSVLLNGKERRKGPYIFPKTWKSIVGDKTWVVFLPVLCPVSLGVRTMLSFGLVSTIELIMSSD